MAESEDQLKTARMSRIPGKNTLERMVMTFRVSELQMLLGYAGKNKTGRKNELQSRALEIVRLRNPTIQHKIKELYKSIQLEMSFGERSQTTAGTPAATLHPAQKVSLSLGSIPGYSQTGASHLAQSHSTRYSNAATTAAATTLGGGVVYPTLAAAAHGSSYPINPDVKLKNLPFYDVLGELLKPSTLAAPQGSGRYQESSFTFSLTPQQANKIANSRDLRPGRQDYTIQVQMRFCLLETTCEQDDNFPPNIAVKINDKMCPLPSPIPTNKPGVEPKRPSRPVNVTTLCRISPTVTNRIQVSWASEYGRCYVISVYLVQKLTSDDLLQRLKNRGVKIADFTRSLIKQKLQEDADCEIATTSLRCSLMCPLGKMRMLLPCRAHTCGHLQCFDASLYLQMNERKPTWTCPVCDKPAVYDNLVIDGYFQEVLIAATNCNEVTLHKDGTWTPLIPKKEKEPAAEKVSKSAAVAVETLSDDSEDESKEPEEASIVEEVNGGRKRASAEPEIITLTDSEEEDENHQPPAPKRPSNTSGSSSGGNNTAGVSGETTPHGSGMARAQEARRGGGERRPERRVTPSGQEEEERLLRSNCETEVSWCMSETEQSRMRRASLRSWQKIPSLSGCGTVLQPNRHPSLVSRETARKTTNLIDISNDRGGAADLLCPPTRRVVTRAHQCSSFPEQTTGTKRKLGIENSCRKSSSSKAETGNSFWCRQQH
ncbi:E3 SUMO-protein ligase Su(var)2-10 isoform X6 [Oratosquilla oratoria]|uniref:E3 SUMO-protein ligase Su(var)2-10 isoform X6 n=1 Tax=Oratosquilla oratoria TaxID=337810 RepID=UPI003F771CDC